MLTSSRALAGRAPRAGTRHWTPMSLAGMRLRRRKLRSTSQRRDWAQRPFLPATLEVQILEDFSYDITCSQETFDRIKMDERFLALLTLARVINALRFCQKAAIDAKAVAGPAGARAWINSFLFAASVLYEGFLAVERLAVHFKDFDSYRNGFAVLLKDRATQSLRQSVLHRMRNKFVFHFDRDVAKESFDHFFELPVYKFASGTGRASGEMYFGLADEAVMNYLLQPADQEPDESVKTRYKKIVQDTTQLMGRFTESAERLMMDVMADMGFALVEANGEALKPEKG
jgi:hypothetical protein